MSNETQAKKVFHKALKVFPYTLEPTGITQGDIEEIDGGMREYSEEFIFEAGNLLAETLLAGGWIEYRQDGDDISVTGFFGIARNGDWKQGSILKEYEALQGWYNLETKQWELSIDTY